MEWAITSKKIRGGRRAGAKGIALPRGRGSVRIAPAPCPSERAENARFFAIDDDEAGGGHGDIRERGIRVNGRRCVRRVHHAQQYSKFRAKIWGLMLSGVHLIL